MTHFYVDPVGDSYRPPNLIERLARVPATHRIAPRENQMTETLAWLLDRSPTLARRFAQLFFAGDPEASAALERATTFGTRTQLSLPVPGRGTVFPDLSLAGDARTFELLVEVKVYADPHAFVSEGGDWMLQPDWYVEAWDARAAEAAEGQALVRRVGTLTRGFDFAKRSKSPTRGRDVTWVEVVEAFKACASSGLEPAADAVAADFLQAVRRLVLGLEETLPDEEHVGALLSDGRDVLLAVGERLRSSLGVSGAEKFMRRRDYQGTYFKTTTPDGVPLNFWLTVDPAGGRFNVPGAPDSIRVRLFEKPAELDEGRVLAGGFVWEENRAGYREFQLHWPIASERGRITNIDELVETVAAGIATALRACQPPLVA